MNDRHDSRRRRRSIRTAMMVAGLAPLLALLGTGAPERAAGQPPTKEHGANGNCTRCHSCARPTSAEPCLPVCARPRGEVVDQALANKHGPKVVILDELEDLYQPVPFDHEGHAKMLEMTGGCAVCHHYTPERVEHPACKTCHEVGPGQGDVRKPALKGAYHRQCISCHREWGGETGCQTCHPLKAGAPGGAIVAGTPTPDDIMGQMHPPIPEPDLEMYRTEREGYPSTKVLFRHREHIHQYDLRCSDCHREDNCTRCHSGDRPHVQRVRTLDEHHQPCFSCHSNDGCDHCHFEEGKPAPVPFSHASTGWPLNRYHQDRGCRACHSSVPYRPLDTSCDGCHRSWAAGKFDHTLTGQRLNETHAAFECADCHVDRKFEGPPSCSGCHDEEEGVTFPAKRPGPVVTPPAAARTGAGG